MVYDSDRTLANSAALLGVPVPARALGFVLDRTPARAPEFLTLVTENGTAKVFQVKTEKQPAILNLHGQEGIN